MKVNILCKAMDSTAIGCVSGISKDLGLQRSTILFWGMIATSRSLLPGDSLLIYVDRRHMSSCYLWAFCLGHTLSHT